jgi:hypothetical protein
MRSGVNGNETQLTPLNVTSATFGKLFSYPVDEHIYGQPLYVPNLTVGGKTHNVIFVATENDTVYAFDADQNTGGPLWQTSLLDAASGETAVPCADVDGCSIATVIGVTATPVISLANNAIYVEARSKLNGAYFHKLHALDLNTGAEKSGSPVTIQASVPGVGAESDSQGNVNFNPLRENDRGALLLVNNVVYLTFASLSDVIPYHGWVLGYSADTLQQVAVFNVTPNGGEGGIWANNGPAADGNGNIFAVVGNGTASAPNLNYGESYLKLSGTLKLLDYFMPFNSSTLNSTDVDVGSGGLLLLPDQAGTTHPHLLVAAGKEGRIYLVDRDNMGQFNAPGDTQIVQSLAPKTVGANFYSPVYWNGIVYFSGTGDVVKAFSLQNGLVSTTPVMQASTTFTFPGGGMVLSANGNASGILWVAEWHTSSHAGTLHAYDAQDLTHELWNSDQNATRDAEGNTTRLNVPLVINGKVYVGSNGKVLVYGLL